MTYFITTSNEKVCCGLKIMFFVVKYCIKHIGVVKIVVFLINNCLGAMTTWLLSGYYPVSGSHFLLTGIRWTTIRYCPVSGKMVSGTSLTRINTK